MNPARSVRAACAVIAALAALNLTGCTGAQEPAATPSIMPAEPSESAQPATAELGLKIGYCMTGELFIEDLCAELGLEDVQYEEAPIDTIYESLKSGEYDLVFAPRYEDMEGADAQTYARNAVIYRKVEYPLDRPNDADYTSAELAELFIGGVKTEVNPVSFYSAASESFFSYQLLGAVTPFSGNVWRNDKLNFPDGYTSPVSALGDGFYTGELEGMTFIWPAEYVEYAYSDSAGSMKAAVPVSVDGVAPTDETVLSGEYPLTYELCVAVRSSEPAGSEARSAAEFMVSAEGQWFLNRRTFVIDLENEVPSLSGSAKYIGADK